MDPIQWPPRGAAMRRALVALGMLGIAGCEGPGTLESLHPQYIVTTIREAYDDPGAANVHHPAGAKAFVKFDAEGSGADMHAILEDATITMNGAVLDKLESSDLVQFGHPDEVIAPLDPEGYTFLVERPGESIKVSLAPVTDAVLDVPSNGAQVSRASPLTVSWSPAAPAGEGDQLVMISADGLWSDPDLLSTETTFDPAELAEVAGGAGGDVDARVVLARYRGHSMQGSDAFILEVLDVAPVTLTP